MANWVTQMRKGILEYAVLLLLESEEKYALNIVHCLKQYTCFQVSESTVYPILGRLKREGKVTVRITPSSKGPPRRYFSLATNGRRQLREMKDYLRQMNQSMADIEKGKEGETN